ncbi:putative leader peptide [Streptomyces sp. XM4193]
MTGAPAQTHSEAVEKPPVCPLLTCRRHIDLLRVAGAS